MKYRILEIKLAGAEMPTWHFQKKWFGLFWITHTMGFEYKSLKDYAIRQMQKGMDTFKVTDNWDF